MIHYNNILAQIWGNIISSTILKPASVENATIFDTRLYCGANDCPNREFKTKKTDINTVSI